MVEPASEPHKAAIVLLNLPRREAGALVARLEPDQARQLERAISRSQLASENEQRLILREFTAQGDRGVGQADFDFLSTLDAQVLAPFLLDELPQTIAVVLRHVPRELAAGVLRELPLDKQVAVSRRLASAGLIESHVVGDVARELRRQMADVLRTARPVLARLETAHAVPVGDVWRLMSRAKAG